MILLRQRPNSLRGHWFPLVPHPDKGCKAGNLRGFPILIVLKFRLQNLVRWCNKIALDSIEVSCSDNTGQEWNPPLHVDISCSQGFSGHNFSQIQGPKSQGCSWIHIAPTQEKHEVLAVLLSPWNLCADHRDRNQTKETFAHYHKYEEFPLGAPAVTHGTFPGNAKGWCQWELRQPSTFTVVFKTCRVKPLPLKCT